MNAKEKWNRQVRRTAFLTVALAAALVFGIVVLASGDWIPGTIIVVASLIGLVREMPVIRRLCSTPSEPPQSARTSQASPSFPLGGARYGAGPAARGALRKAKYVKGRRRHRTEALKAPSRSTNSLPPSGGAAGQPSSWRRRRG